MKNFTRQNMEAEWVDYWDECAACEEYEKRLESARDYFTGVFEVLSSKEAFDAAKLENCLEELDGVLGAKCNMNDLNFVEKLTA